MSLRDNMATQVLAALVSNPTITNAASAASPDWARTIGKLAYIVADRALERRQLKAAPDPLDQIK